jgi:hypothetical protein
LSENVDISRENADVSRENVDVSMENVDIYIKNVYISLAEYCSLSTAAILLRVTRLI